MASRMNIYTVLRDLTPWRLQLSTRLHGVTLLCISFDQGSIPSRGRHVSPLHAVADPPSYSMGTGSSFPRGRVAKLLLPRLGMHGAIPPIPPFDFIPGCLITHRDSVTFRAPLPLSQNTTSWGPLVLRQDMRAHPDVLRMKSSAPVLARTRERYLVKGTVAIGTSARGEGRYCSHHGIFLVRTSVLRPIRRLDSSSERELARPKSFPIKDENKRMQFLPYALLWSASWATLRFSS
jgi:hypothetical protein